MHDLITDETGGHGGDLAAAIERWAPPGGKMLDFSSNINPLGPPPGLYRHLQSLLPRTVAYPVPQARELKEALSRYLDLPAEKLLLGNGANELIHLLMLWRRPGRVLIPAPSFSEYEKAAGLAGSAVERFMVFPGDAFDPGRLAGQLRAGDMLIFCNPNNPTGHLCSRRELLPLVEAAENCGAEVVVDESFIPLTVHPEESLRSLENENLWVVMSLTKIWGLPGLRLGCASGPAGPVRTLSRLGDPWRVNMLAQEAGLYCLEHPEHERETRALVESERLTLAGELREAGYFRVFDGSANFLLLRGPDRGFHVSSCQEHLARRGLLVRRADNFHGLDHRYLRIAVRTGSENRRLLQEFRSLQDGLPVVDSGGEKGGVSR